MAEDRSGLYLISIVAVVAVVGLVTLFMRGGEAQPMQGELVEELDEEGNVVGQAYYLRGGSVSPARSRYVVPRVASQQPPASEAEMCSDTDNSYSEIDRKYYKGSVRYWDSPSRTWMSSSDRCSTRDTLMEQYCFEGGKGEKNVSCGFGCSNGACLLG